MKGLRTFVVCLVLFNGLAACGGGLVLIIDPSGNAMQMSTRLLEHSPFSDFLIPGVLLLLVNGLSSLWISWIVIQRKINYQRFIVLQGLLLIGWILIQVLLIREVSWLHYSFGGLGMVLIGAGLKLRLIQPTMRP